MKIAYVTIQYVAPPGNLVGTYASDCSFNISTKRLEEDYKKWLKAHHWYREIFRKEYK